MAHAASRLSIAHTDLDERRGSERTIALFRPGLVKTECGTAFYCLVRNVSSSGFMATVYAPVAPGQVISLRLNETIEFHGRIVWCEDDRIGIEFGSEIDVASTLAELTADRTGVRRHRPPRIPLEARAQFFVHSQPHEIHIRDISQRGVKAEIGHLKEGETGTLVIPGMQPRRAAVRWQDRHLAGFYFIEPIGFAELGQWILEYHNRRQQR